MPLGSNHHRLIEVDKVSLKMVVLTNLLNNDDHFASLRFVIKSSMPFKLDSTGWQLQALL